MDIEQKLGQLATKRNFVLFSFLGAILPYILAYSILLFDYEKSFPIVTAIGYIIIIVAGFGIVPAAQAHSKKHVKLFLCGIGLVILCSMFAYVFIFRIYMNLTNSFRSPGEDIKVYLTVNEDKQDGGYYYSFHAQPAKQLGLPIELIYYKSKQTPTFYKWKSDDEMTFLMDEWYCVMNVKRTDGKINCQHYIKK